MKNVFILSFLFLLSLPVTSGAQSNSFLDEYLAKDKASCGDSAYLVLSIAGIIPDTGTAKNALEAIAGKKWNISFKDENAPITLGEFSYLVMRAYNMGGGLFYSGFPGPRYAGRELAYQGFIKGDPNPGRQISGREAFSILRRVIETTEGE